MLNSKEQIIHSDIEVQF